MSVDAASGCLLAGYAAVDITPALGTAMGGYWGRETGVKVVNDPLYVRTITLSSPPPAASGAGGRAATEASPTVVLISFDLIGLHRADSDGIVEAVRARVPAVTSRDDVLVACTHTHTGPQTHCGFVGMGEPDAAYMRALRDAAAEAVAQAVSGAAPASVHYAKVDAGGPTGFSVNRRQRTDEAGAAGAGQGSVTSPPAKLNAWEAVGKVVLGQRPDGPRVDYAHVVSFRRDAGSDGHSGELLCAMLSYPCHPVCIGKASVISADFPGILCSEISKGVGAPVMFVNGACGDVNPIHRGGGYEKTRRACLKLQDEIASVLQTPTRSARIAATCVRGVMHEAQLPLNPPPPVGTAITTVKRLEKELSDAVERAGSGSEWKLLVPSALLQQAKLELREARLWVSRAEEAAGPAKRARLDDEGSSAAERSRGFRVQCIRIGELCVVAAEGEMFAEYQLESEQRLCRRPDVAAAVFVGVANGCIGYVPTAAEFPLGGCT